MNIIGFNGSPRRKGNTSALMKAVLEGAASAGATTTEVKLHELNMKGCMGCGSCNEKNFGTCAQKDELSPFLEGIKSCDGVVFGCPIYMYRLSGQMKLLVDRMYSLYSPKKVERGYNSEVPPGKTFALVISQGAENPNQYERSARWLAGMAGTGLGMTEVGRVIHCGSRTGPAENDAAILEEARELGRKLVRR